MVITGLTRNQFAGNRTWVRIPPAPPPKKPVIKPIAGFFLMSFSKSKRSEHTAFFSLLNLGFIIFPSTSESIAFGQSKPCFHRLRRGDFRAVIKVGVYVCHRGKITVPEPLLNGFSGTPFAKSKLAQLCRIS